MSSQLRYTFQKVASQPTSCLHMRTQWEGYPVLGAADSCQVLYHKEHDCTCEQHPTDHEVLVLEGPLLN